MTEVTESLDHVMQHPFSRFMRIFAITCIWLLAPLEAQNESDRHPVPAGEAYQAFLARQRQLLGDPGKLSAGRCSALALEHFERASPPARGAVDADNATETWTSFVRLTFARELALIARNTELAFGALELQAQHFEIDSLQIELDMLRSALDWSRGSTREELLSRALRLASRSTRERNWQIASQTLDCITRLTRLPAGVDQALGVLGREMTFLESIEARTQADEEITDTSADETSTTDAQESSATQMARAGKGACILEGDWKRGLALLASGDDATWREAAVLDRETDQESGAERQIGAARTCEAWANLAESLIDTSPRAATALLERARSWLAEVIELERDPLTERIDELHGRAMARSELATWVRAEAKKSSPKTPKQGPTDAREKTGSQRSLIDQWTIGSRVKCVWTRPGSPSRLEKEGLVVANDGRRRVVQIDGLSKTTYRWILDLEQPEHPRLIELQEVTKHGNYLLDPKSSLSMKDGRIYGRYEWTLVMRKGGRRSIKAGELDWRLIR